VGLDGSIGSFNDRVHGSSKTRGRFACAGGMWSNVGGLSAEHASEAGLARHGMMGQAKPNPMRAIPHSLRSMAPGKEAPRSSKTRIAASAEIYC
jgi:hypothetical protein